jgi:uncharacterized membrane protein YidH (DUF202 family)
VEAVKKFIAERGLTLMVFGMCTVLTGVIAYMFMKQRWGIYSETPWPTATIALAAVGLVVYAVGRVSVAMQRSRRAKTPSRASSGAPGDGDGDD